MKKTMILAIVIVFAFGMFIVGGSDAKVTGSFHDFSAGSLAWIYNGAAGGDILGTGSTQVCVFCHHPHRTVLASIWTNEVLWNLSAASIPSYATYNSTTSETINGVALDVSATSGLRSYLCLSCHDGTIATGALIALPRDKGTNVTNALTMQWGNLGTTLEDDHPVNITVDDTNDAGLLAPADIILADLPLYGASFDTIQCSTCHDVHDNGTAGAGGSTASTGVQFMRLNVWATDSAICVVCHINK